jgi:hypothetical protein
VAKTWLIIALMASLVVNALFIGFIIGRPFHPPVPPLPPFPPCPPSPVGELVPGLREHMSLTSDSTRKHLRQLRQQLVQALASDPTNPVQVDSLLDAIGVEQRKLQESIITYLDSLKTVAPGPNRLELRRWIMDCFGEMGPGACGISERHHGKAPITP